MTQIQENKLMRALDLLAQSGLSATAIHTPSNTFYMVLNRSETKKQGRNCYHMVYRSQETGKFVCDCYHGAIEGNVCVHKAAAAVAENGGDIETYRHSLEQEQDHIDMEASTGHDVFAAVQIDPILIRRDTGIRLYMD